ncbi:DUF2784 domain-containing protein [Sphingomonas sp. CGMCC 1.13654]|uniref:DUF2784 domain-containing protein n=1 Tax=Sphingomonas chungangi TaxID=2683589 RepID=A0A838L8W6_9SPHN|nr:DUF2784 domain-containing protein [Sphingomonas chungangi]MBA2935212.1 DUF2784 domain-containing protein [Sphingomonas chungangi]MVW55290.1 DUF2784 family protein [Sphingomonas chungangi]
MLGLLILAVHVGIILFNIFGLIAIPFGAWRRWSFVRAPVWRYLHILSLGLVAVQAALGRACFLTIWQDALTEGAPESQPLIARTVDALIYWPIPIWVFAVGYVLIFAYALALMWFVPPRRFGRP